MTQMEMLEAIERLFRSLPAGRIVRLSDVARTVSASPEEVEPAIIHLMGRGIVHQAKRRRSGTHHSGHW